ncbi:MAG: winged helix DNA-binding domain-containing protein [Acidimicrobiia bacterium]|nr:winged helix DNA-binding domain-containing protein [Acidimicrobiia bacterium]
MTLELDIEQWHRQLLQRNRKLSVVEGVVNAGGLYSTAPTSYLSLIARVPGFVRGDLDRALYEDRSLVRMAALRGSGFLIPLDLIDNVVAATDRGYVFAKWADKLVGSEQVEAWRADLFRLLDGQVLPARKIREELGVSGKSSEALRYVLSSMISRRELAAASGPKSWRDNQHGYALWSQWFRGHRPRQVDPTMARIEVAEWYLQGHGPATAGDFAWFAGMKEANAQAALEGSAAVEVGDGWFDLLDRKPPADPDGLRLLPVWDTALVRQEQWRRMVHEDHYRFVYDASGNVTSSIVRDGAVVGVWDRGGDNDRLVVKAAFFEPAGRGMKKLVDDEAAVVARAVGVSDLEVEFVSSVVDLHAASRNRFMSPLSGS